MTKDGIVALVGLRASGKTTVGRLLAAELGRVFVDLDEEIADSFAKRGSARRISAGEILAARGEPEFRDLEETALRTVLGAGACVMATGGGIVERATNRRRLARETTCVWLDVDVAELQRRMRVSAVVRPSLTGKDPIDEIADIEARRRAWYAEVAELRIDCGSMDAGAVATRIAAWLATR